MKDQMTMNSFIARFDTEASNPKIPQFAPVCSIIVAFQALPAVVYCTMSIQRR
ncbi:hypothetical protein K402DRAFT_394246 [Aulographum hederae CBS 113979]|uniref:Uncharacterized protein n=1 Tax=Aulographum hederae CBS 113979 TaxID=1176131 RepID=A0A6G1GZ46_9PEZI|nr:hypothetical protein K402DRAFT_394246 [Aulographum hederae CBS 113979]